MDAAVEKKPFIEAADAAEFAGSGARVDAVIAKVAKEVAYVLLAGGEQDAVTVLEEFGKGIEVARVGLASEWTEASFDPQVGAVFGEQGEIAGGVHKPDYGLAVAGAGDLSGRRTTLNTESTS